MVFFSCMMQKCLKHCLRDILGLFVQPCRVVSKRSAGCGHLGCNMVKCTPKAPGQPASRHTVQDCAVYCCLRRLSMRGASRHVLVMYALCFCICTNTMHGRLCLCVQQLLGASAVIVVATTSGSKFSQAANVGHASASGWAEHTRVWAPEVQDMVSRRFGVIHPSILQFCQYCNVIVAAAGRMVCTGRLCPL